MESLKHRSYQNSAYGAKWRETRDLLLKGWNWWLAELKALLPSRVRERIDSSGRLLILAINEDELSVSFGAHDRQVPVSKFSLRALGESGSVSLQKYQARADRVILTLPESKFLFTEVYLPEAARNDLANVIRFELDRYTPYKSEQVYYDYLRPVQPATASQIKVQLVVLGKQQIDPWLEQLNSSDIKVDQILPATNSISDFNNLSLLPSGAKRKSRKLPLRWKVFLILLLLIGAYHYEIGRLESQKTELEQRVAQPRVEAERLRQIEAELNRRVGEGDYLQQQRVSRNSPLDLLKDLTLSIPEHTWLSRISLEGVSLRIEGESQQASSLLTLLDQTGHFTEIRFASPVILNNRSGKERFAILAVLKEEGQ